MITTNIYKQAAELRQKLINLPTEYFEIKPQRGVNLEEFSGALIPNNALESTEKILKKRGINKIFKYSNEEERKQLTKKFPELMFSIGGMTSIGALSGLDEGT